MALHGALQRKASQARAFLNGFQADLGPDLGHRQIGSRRVHFPCVSTFVGRQSAPLARAPWAGTARKTIARVRERLPRLRRGAIASAASQPDPDGAMTAHSDLLQTALDAAEAGARVIRHYYQSNLAVQTKPDKSPVTVADVETEQAIHAVIRERYPQHGFYGEETGQSSIDAEYLWLVDPIDGTKAFVREYPMFSTQIALMHRGQLVLGVSSAPMFNELAYAEVGKGAWLNDKPLRVSDVDSVERAALSASNLKTLAKSPQWTRFGDIVARVDRIRGYGDFFHYHLLAAGKIDAVLESDVNILDIAALVVIVREAGGTFTDLEGNAPGLETRSVLATNGKLHDGLLGALKEAR
jgi:histidinol-phosphatase